MRPEDASPPGPIRDTLSDLTQAIAGLRERLREMGISVPEPPTGQERVGPVEAEGLDTLREALGIPSAGHGPAEVFGIAMDRLNRLLEADRAMLFLLDPERGALVPVAARGFRRDDLGGTSVASGEGLIGRTFREARPLAYGRSPEEAPRDPFVARFPVRDAVAVPVRAEDQVLGVLFAGRRGRGGPFTPPELALLLVIADRVATAFVQERLVGRAAEHVARLRELEQLAGHALLGADLAEILALASETACRVASVRTAVIALAERDEPGGPLRLRLAASSGLSGGAAAAWRSEPEEGLGIEAWSTGRPVIVSDLREHRGAAEPFLHALDARGCLVVPLRARERPIGLLYLADTRPREFPPDEREAAQMLAGLAAQAVENDRLYRELRSALDTMQAAQEGLVQAEKSRALGAMAAGVAHEFNNILAIVLGKVQLLLARTQDESVREPLAQVEEAAWRAADTVRRLQGFAATRTTEPAIAVDVNTLVHDAVTLTRGLWKDEAEARGVAIEVVTDLEDVPPVRGSAVELREAVTNLLLNAIDAMPRGGRLRLATRTERDGVRLTVSDSGEGMSDEVRRRIFDPFFSTRSPRRSGLGLSVVHGIVYRHGGRIEVDSAPGRGTTVTLWLPAAPGGGAPAEVAPLPLGEPARREPDSPFAAPATTAASPSEARGLAPTEPGPPAAAVAPAEPAGTPAAPAAPGETPPEAGAPPSILIIEDEAQIRSMLEEALGGAGYTVASAADGLEGLARFQRGRFDLVLTDLSLPERSGLDVAMAVKRMRPGMPVVLMTGWGHMLDPVRLRERGVDLTLIKPFRLERALAVVAEALRLGARG